MSFALLSSYVSKTSEDPKDGWTWQKLVDSAGNIPPDAVIALRTPVIEADAYAIWLRWYMEGVCNPLNYVERSPPATKIDVYVDVLCRIDELSRPSCRKNGRSWLRT